MKINKIPWKKLNDIILSEAKHEVLNELTVSPKWLGGGMVY